MNQPAPPPLMRAVPAASGWRWLAEGFALFRRNAPLWAGMILVLYVGLRLVLLLPFVGLIAALVAPNFLAGLCHGAQALDRGKRLRMAYLVSGFLKNAAALVTLGGISIAGQLAILMLMTTIAGDEIKTVAMLGAKGLSDPANAARLQAVAPAVMKALYVGAALSLPLIMATWFAPLLVFFDDLKPLPAMWLSLRACLKNILPFLIYGSALTLAMMLLAPVVMATGELYIGLWLLAPMLLPSVYASYKDIFPTQPVTQA